MKEHLVISTSTDLLRIPSEQIVYIAADGNYSEVHHTDGERHLVTLQLGQIEVLISQQLTQSRAHFIRIGRSLIINRTFINYINLPKQQLILSDGRATRHELTASREALKQLKELLERELRS